MEGFHKLWKDGKLIFNEYRVSVLEGEKSSGDDGGDVCTTI